MGKHGAERSAGLSKSRFVAGRQCHKLLWLRTYEADAPELKVSAALQDIFDQGNEVGRLARAQFPGGRLVDLDHYDPNRTKMTKDLMDSGAPAVFEATFIQDRVFAAIDVLLREKGGYTLIEVKSGGEVKDKYVLDAAIQTHVARRAGVPIARVEVMHLNKEYVHPGPEPLFVRENVTTLVEDLLDGVPDEIDAQLKTLAGEEPAIAIGPFCRDNNGCPFMSRCWPSEPDSVLGILGMHYKKRFELFHGGTKSIKSLPAGFKLNPVQARQRKACETGELVVDSSLKQELAPYQGVLGFLDFETVGRALPVWSGTRPWEQIGVQFSYHEGKLGGPYTHEEFLAEPDTDPREAIARRLIEVTRRADHVVMYTGFEKTQIGKMQRFVPALADDLEKLRGKLLDLAQVVHRTVYHPLFGGSLSIKTILQPLVGISYKGTVEITDGSEASAELARLLFYSGTLTPAERKTMRDRLLEYCALDTMAMVKLLERLEALSAA